MFKLDTPETNTTERKTRPLKMEKEFISFLAGSPTSKKLHICANFGLKRVLVKPDNEKIFQVCCACFVVRGPR